MSDALAVNTSMPSGWYDDPATPDLQRWWSGTAWSDHVRYGDKIRPRPVAAEPVDEAPTAVQYAPPAFGAAAFTGPTPVLDSDSPFRSPFGTRSSFASDSPFGAAAAYTPAPAFEAAPIAPAFSADGSSALAYVPPPSPVTEGFDDFYVPMRSFGSGASNAYAVLSRRRVMPRGAVWLITLPLVGIAAGVVLWLVLPR